MPPLYAQLTFFAKVLEFIKTLAMIYQINGLPIGWAGCPPFVANWLKQLKIKGQKVGDEIIFKWEEIRAELTKQKVPHIADFLGNNDLQFPETSCIEQKN